MSYMKVNCWFTETSGMGLGDRRRAVMRPSKVKKEEEIFDAEIEEIFSAEIEENFNAEVEEAVFQMTEETTFGILDTGASHSVIAESEVRSHLERLKQKGDFRMPRTENRRTVYKTIAGKSCSTRRITLPVALFGDRQSYVVFDVFEGEIPTLLSRKCMEKMHVVLDMGENTVSFRGKKYPLIGGVKIQLS